MKKKPKDLIKIGDWCATTEIEGGWKDFTKAVPRTTAVSGPDDLRNLKFFFVLPCKIWVRWDIDLLLQRKWEWGASKYLPSASWEWSRWEWQIPSEMGTRRTAQTSIKQEWNENPAFLGRIVTAVIGRWTITSLAPAMILSVNGKSLLLWTMSYPRKYFAWDKAIIMAEEEIKPEITEWLMNRSSQPSLQQQHNKQWE